jgi:hypothetical protein
VAVLVVEVVQVVEDNRKAEHQAVAVEAAVVVVVNRVNKLRLSQIPITMAAAAVLRLQVVPAAVLVAVVLAT